MSSPFHREEGPAPIADVNVVPLADVSLVLLIILLVLSPMAAQSMLRIATAAAKASAPEGPKAGEDPLNPKPPEPVLAVGLTAVGFVADGALIGGDRELRAWLGPRLARREDRKVFLSPDLDVPHGAVVRAIEAISGIGSPAPSVALVQVADPEAP